jgi:hypothetical protein
MQHTKNAYLRFYDLVSRDVRCAIDDQFACAFDSTRPASLRKLPQSLHMLLNTIIHGYGGPRTIRFDKVEDGLTVRQCELRPLQMQCLPCLTQRCGAAFRETRLYFAVRNTGAGVVQGLSYLSAEPCVVDSRIGSQQKGWSTLVRGAGEEDAHSFRNC